MNPPLDPDEFAAWLNSDDFATRLVFEQVAAYVEAALAGLLEIAEPLEAARALVDLTARAIGTIAEGLLEENDDR